MVYGILLGENSITSKVGRDLHKVDKAATKASRKAGRNLKKRHAQLAKV